MALTSTDCCLEADCSFSLGVTANRNKPSRSKQQEGVQHSSLKVASYLKSRKVRSENTSQGSPAWPPRCKVRSAVVQSRGLRQTARPSAAGIFPVLATKR